MRNLFIISIVMLSLASCSNQPQQQLQPISTVQYNGTDSVVYVQYPNQNGGYDNFYMDYLIYQSLYNSGGYGSVYNNYHMYPQRYYHAPHYYDSYRVDYNRTYRYGGNTFRRSAPSSNSSYSPRSITTPYRGTLYRPNAPRPSTTTPYRGNAPSSNSSYRSSAPSPSYRSSAPSPSYRSSSSSSFRSSAPSSRRR